MGWDKIAAGGLPDFEQVAQLGQRYGLTFGPDAWIPGLAAKYHLKLLGRYGLPINQPMAATFTEASCDGRAKLSLAGQGRASSYRYGTRWKTGP